MTPCGGPAGVEADKIRTELGINYHMVRKESADPKLTVSCGPHCRNTIMKLTKNAAALLLAASLAVSICATPVFATEIKTNPGGIQETTGVTVSDMTSSQDAHTKLTYTIVSSYKWSIPSDVNFGDNESLDNDIVANNVTKSTVEVDECHIPNNKVLKIKIKGNGGGSAEPTEASKSFKIKSGENKTLDYEVRASETTSFDSSNPLEVDGEVLSVNPGTKKVTRNLQFTLKTKLAGGSENKAEYAGSYVGYAIFTAGLE